MINEGFSRCVGDDESVKMVSIYLRRWSDAPTIPTFGIFSKKKNLLAAPTEKNRRK